VAWRVGAPMGIQVARLGRPIAQMLHWLGYSRALDRDHLRGGRRF
jgi:hypothetical protein